MGHGAIFLETLPWHLRRVICKLPVNGKTAAIKAGKIVEEALNGRMAAAHPGKKVGVSPQFVITGGTVAGEIIIMEAVLLTGDVSVPVTL